MSQKFSLYDELTVHENLMFYGRLVWVARRGARTNAAMNWWRSRTSNRICERRAALLSGGWRQRLAMACSLMHQPTRVFSGRTDRGH